MSRGILNSKDKLDKNIYKFCSFKTNFNTYKNIIRQSIVEAKKLYSKNTFFFKQPA